jgi:hypothetical protein
MTQTLIPGLTFEILDTSVDVSFECEPGAFYVGDCLPRFFFATLMRRLALRGGRRLPTQSTRHLPAPYGDFRYLQGAAQGP